MVESNEEPAGEKPPDPPPSPAPAAKADPPGQSATAAASDALGDMRDRLGLAQSGVLVAALALAGVAFLAATIGLIIYTTADGGDSEFDGAAMLDLAFGAGIGAAALFVLLRHQSGPRSSVDEGGRDLKIAYAIGGLIAVWSLLGLFKAFDESWSGQDGWFAYARVYAALFVAWLAIAKPVPPMIGTMSSVMIGFVKLGAAGGLLVLGQFMAMSDDASTWINGVAFQNLGIVTAIAVLGWYLGLRGEERA